MAPPFYSVLVLVLVPARSRPGPGPVPVADPVRPAFHRGRVGAGWTSDVIYLHTDQRWLSLGAVRDACSG